MPLPGRLQIWSQYLQVLPFPKSGTEKLFFRKTNQPGTYSGRNSTKKIKRGKRKSLKYCKYVDKSMFILGYNSAGILNKQESFYRNINLFNPIAFFLQETKTRFKNKLRHPNYTFFEYIRKHGGGGGLITAVHNNLHPVQVSNDDATEVLVVETKIDDMKVRLINGYGPQETDEENSKAFMNRIDLEVKRSMLAGALVCLEMDANSKLGPDILKNDPKEESKNGKLLVKVIEENDLVVVNGTDLCDGVITSDEISCQIREF